MRLEVEDLVTGYGQIQVLNGVSITVPEGKVVGLLGPNGVGKTTLLRTIAGFTRPWTGQIRIDGRNLGRDTVTSRARAGICLVPEGRAVFPALTVLENIAMHAQVRKPKAAVEAACEVFPVLRSRLKQSAGTLSGGEQQMLAMSRAVIRNSPILLADELSLGLAPIVLDTIFSSLEKMKGGGTSMLIVEQYAERLFEFADYIYVLNKGRPVLEGTPSDISREELWRAQG